MSVVRDTWLIFRHNVRISLRQKAGIIFGVLQPLLYLVLFGPLFVTIGPWETLIPGLLIQVALFSSVWPGSASSWTPGPGFWNGCGSLRRTASPCCSAVSWPARSPW